MLELLVVMVIIGLLAAYVGPRYFSQIGKSERNVAKAQLDGLAGALDAYLKAMGLHSLSEAAAIKQDHFDPDMQYLAGKAHVKQWVFAVQP